MERVLESRPGLIAEANRVFFRRVLINAGIKLDGEPAKEEVKNEVKKPDQLKSVP